MQFIVNIDSCTLIGYWRLMSLISLAENLETPRTSSGACFSKVPKLFGCISGDIIVFVSSKRRRLEARNFAGIFYFYSLYNIWKTSFTEQAGRSFTNDFSGPKSSRDFRETGPRHGLWLDDEAIDDSTQTIELTLIATAATVQRDQ